jgi:predicted aconitase
VAYGDTGVVIYSNSVSCARSNFEGGPSALAAALTGRTPRDGYHLDKCRRSTRRVRLTDTPCDFSEWGAVGFIVGGACGSYWQVPVIERVAEIPSSDALKHFGTALASFGSVALFHMPSITAEDAAFAGPRLEAVAIGLVEIDAFVASYDAAGDKLDIVVFGAPQSSFFEVERVAQALDGRHVYPDTTVRINGWTRLMTNSAKLVNIIGGYGYRPSLASLERCVDSAVAGRIL